MSNLTKERVQYLQKIVKKENVYCPPEKKFLKRRQGKKYWYLEPQEFNDWTKWMKYVDEINEKSLIQWRNRPSHIRVVWETYFMEGRKGTIHTIGGKIPPADIPPRYLQHPPKLDYWDPPEHNGMVVVMAEEVNVLDPV